MGEVYRARDTRLGREVAIKVLPAHLSSHPRVKERFEREADHTLGLLPWVLTDRSPYGFRPRASAGQGVAGFSAGSSGRSRISIRRFWRRPASESLEARGRYSA